MNPAVTQTSADYECAGPARSWVVPRQSLLRGGRVWLPKRAVEGPSRMLRTSQSQGYVNSAVLAETALLTYGLKERMAELLHIRAGNRVVDVGCGPGIDTVETAGLIGETGLVVGIDHDEAMISEAQERARKAGVGAWTRHEVADAASIPYEAGFFDASRSERLFQRADW